MGHPEEASWPQPEAILASPAWTRGKSVARAWGEPSAALHGGSLVATKAANPRGVVPPHGVAERSSTGPAVAAY